MQKHSHVPFISHGVPWNSWCFFVFHCDFIDNSWMLTSLVFSVSLSMNEQIVQVPPERSSDGLQGGVQMTFMVSVPQGRCSDAICGEVLRTTNNTHLHGEGE